MNSASRARPRALALVTFFAAMLVALHGCSPNRASPPGEDAGPQTPSDGTGKPCKSSAECPTGLCVPLEGEPVGGRAVCTRECDSTSECVAGWACAPRPGAPNLCQCQSTPETCDGKDNDCNGLVDDIAIPANVCSPIGLNGGPWTCEEGRCTCKAPRVSCYMGAYCSDLKSDRDNCGACGVKCEGIGQCVDGACTSRCPVELTDCSTNCVDLNTDQQNCGECGKVCLQNLTCINGACSCPGPAHEACPFDTTGAKACRADGRCRERLVLQGSEDLVGAIEAGATQVFYTTGPTFGDQSIRRVAKAGGTPEVLATLADQFLPTLATNGTDLVYGTRKTSPVEDVVVLCPAGTCGASAVTLASGTTAAALAVADGFAYWLDGETGDVKRCAISGCSGAPSVVASAPTGATVAPPFSKWEGFLEVDATNVFVGYVGGGLVAKAPVNGGTAEKIGQSTNILNGLAINSTTVFFVETAAEYSTTVGVHRIPKAGGAQSLFESTQPGIAIRADDQNVYWSVPSLYVFRCATTGCVPRYELNDERAYGGFGGYGVGNPRALALDAASLYIGGHRLEKTTN